MKSRVVGQMESWRGLGRRGRAAMSRRPPAPREEARDASRGGGSGVSSAGPGDRTLMSEDAAAGPRDGRRADGADRNDSPRSAASGNGSVVVAGDRTGAVVVAAERTAGQGNAPEQN